MQNPALIAAQGVYDFARTYETRCIFDTFRAGDSGQSQGVERSARSYTQACKDEQDRQAIKVLRL